jgi:drug/metabolite transporter (DMT)-like permease
MPGSTPVRHVAEGATAMSLLGASTAVSAHLTAYPVLGGQMVRYVLASGVLFAILRKRAAKSAQGAKSAQAEKTVRARLKPRDWLLLVALAVTGLVLFNVLVIATLRHTDSATLGSVVACSPLLLAVAGPMVANSGRTLRTRVVLAASAVVVAGSAMVQGFGHGTTLGIVLALGVLVCEVLFSLLAVPLLPLLGELRLSAYITAISVPILLVVGLATERGAFLRAPSVGEAAALLYLALPLTVGAFLLWYRTLQGLGPQRAGLLIGCVPVAACAASVVLGVGTPGPAQLAGVAVVVAGIVGGLALGAREEPSEHSEHSEISAVAEASAVEDTHVDRTAVRHYADVTDIAYADIE